MSSFMKLTLSVLLFLSVCVPSFGQKDSVEHQKIYFVKPKIELTAGVGLTVASFFGFRQLDKVAHLSKEDILKLNPNDLNSFDRPIAFTNPANFPSAEKSSDLFLNISIISPALLMLDKNIRKDWVDLLSMYMMTHAVDNALYFGAAYSIRRPRPLTYNPNLTAEEKMGDGRSNSFFSGHVSFSSTATFFLAKVYTDYHQIKGLKRIGLFTLAAIPPALVGYYRTEAGKHFKSDVITGFVSGAICGILVPEFHKRLQQKKNLTFQPIYSPQFGGVAATLAF
ncbi:phosphatase PAP2 family protein [Flectobacillus sp. BAB-3569]|uniref:phosphatase PAP2 family protein n=1 Tax=Flectobacillus sp. BAB-3569 TaxID=1509483 RepID=UPI000BA44E1E|nr:phosphatase PAP2 family protein [Flectobacillus sp. BAB-3569]PAC31142.1 hypothetical protein BWI92_10510 [Flectobacillus sp. BAB-3569]